MPERPHGAPAIRKALKTIPESPGVYRMIGVKGEVLYVGKALNLKKRVTSYTHVARLPDRLKLMVSLTASMEIVVTRTEAEALLLEANYIKRMKPRFNILLRDDKSYPWLLLSGDHAYPRLMRQRGKPVKGATYWGPFASSRAVDQTIQVIQRAFMLRTCTDSVFESRTRPCLLHQIKRCSAPCVERISPLEYQGLVEQTKEFLSGGGRELQQRLTLEMEQASEELAFERAALIRDRIRGFANLRASGAINPASIQEADVVALWQQAGQSCIQVFFIRGGRNNGNRAFYPRHEADEPAADVLAAFLLQFYEDKQPPLQVLTSSEPAEQPLLTEALSLQRGQKVQILQPQRGEKKAVLDHAILNAREALERRLAETAGQAVLLEKVAELFDLPEPPKRIEVYDNSHLMGQAPYGAMIVGGPEGFVKRAYRKFAIRGPVAPGDDFGMMKEVMTRRFAQLTPDDSGSENWPDLLLIDGGKGQVRVVREILAERGLSSIPVVGIAKGVDRNAGREWFFVEGKEPFQLPVNDAVLYYLQRLRDEVHRFVITTHRAGRSRALTRSGLDEIPGVGPARKKALLTRFGSARHVGQAALEELEHVPGINREMAQVIYGYFHPEWVREQSDVLKKP
ncbi:Excinuclease ABC subunit C [Parasaccharibacter apium]|uniref:UvrABC system protein C n=1 Tax=Parasaccharibacter apium TaxID=1510841 RepID=A0A7U7J145_9PROT|nr:MULTISPECIES: excinuclease ABC subunit UvrC [Acetobacteraceae]MCL1561908.1 excinuclease ABC subunit UvrC [Parasaccharibacter sp. TMW 2.1886]MCL1513227.1 excinuclease ABC subunit UvrC [Parasaccharibacter sp. TMW 2.1891]MCL1514802.1 excinuclease ABC subunit UvrC [Parasaccharibacter sp. TMW2.1890]MCT6814262.1 excinuclease ABC subunit UvrC [Bombella apis]CDG34009.1 Excinuclease ABC subunit C [Parasaccharibacter apium]